MPLPDHYRSILDEIFSGADTAALRHAAQDLSTRYRNRTEMNVGNPAEALAYAATRLPATYGAAAHALYQTGLRRPDFAPRRILDIGAGPGTMTLAALACWQGIEEAQLLEPNEFLAALGKNIFAKIKASGISWNKDNLARAQLPERGFDLVTAGYVLNEIPGDISPLIQKLWHAANDILILIEPGTPHGFDIFTKARGLLLATGAHIIAPCPHETACPLAKDGGERWCHFSERVARSRLHRHLKQGDLAYEDEKFCYLAVSRTPAPLPAFRIIGHPSGAKVRRLQLCLKKGTAETADIARSHPAYKILRKADWGDSGDEPIFP